MTKIELGDTVRDRISGFTGTVIARSEWLYGCVRLGVKSQALNKDGKPMEDVWFDEPQLELVLARNKNPFLSGGGPPREDSGTREPQ